MEEPSADGSTRLVAVELPPGNAFVAAVEKAWAGGDAVLPLAVGRPGRERDRLLGELRPARLVDARGEHLLPDPEPVAGGTALVIATSGTTGTPKGVELTHDALRHAATASLERLGASGGDRWLLCLPVHHVAGVLVILRARLVGTAPILHPRFEPAAVAAESGATHVALVPTMLARLLERGADLRRFAAVVVGGAPTPPGLVERARALGVRIVESYGLTETSGGCVYDGTPLRDVGIRLDDRGRIAVCGPVLFRGYRHRPDLTRAAVRDGWLFTPDLGEWTGDGRLRVVGRHDDVIVTGGEKVAAGEVAALLREHPAVADAAVTGVADPEWGERVVAVCVASDPDAPPTLADLRRFVTDRVAGHKAPRELVVVGSLPRTTLGKIDRRAVARLAARTG